MTVPYVRDFPPTPIDFRSQYEYGEIEDPKERKLRQDYMAKGDTLHADLNKLCVIKTTAFVDNNFRRYMLAIYIIFFYIEHINGGLEKSIPPEYFISCGQCATPKTSSSERG